MKRRYFFLSVAVLSVSLLGVCTGWTVAWLTSETKSVRNLFTVGSVQVQLEETWNADTDGDGEPDSWKGIVVPGTVLIKNPVVSVPEDCEDSWIFVCLQESQWPQSSEMTYAMEEGWKSLPNHDRVWFREVGREKVVRTFPVLKENQVAVSEDLTKQELASMENPQLTVTAYAVQRSGFDSPEAAWTQIQPTA